MQSNGLLYWMETEPFTAPGARNTVPFPLGTSNKSLYSYSLTVKGGGCQRDALNGQNWGLNGFLGQRTVVPEGVEWGLLLGRMGYKFALFGKRDVSIGKS